MYTEETKITSNNYDHPSVGIYGDQVVWYEVNNGTVYGIYKCSLSAGALPITLVDSKARVQYFSYPGLIARKDAGAVWTDCRAQADQQIYACDLNGGQERVLIDRPGNQDLCDFYMNKALWVEGSALYLSNLGVISASQPVKMTSAGNYGKLSENYAVWEDYRLGGSTIYAYDLKAAQLSRLTNSLSARLPVVDADMAVWSEGSNLYKYQFSTKAKSFVGSIESNMVMDMSVDKVVYAGRSSLYYKYPLYIYDLSTSQKFKVTDVAEGVGGYFTPYMAAMYDNKVVWVAPKAPNTISYYNQNNVYVTQFNIAPAISTVTAPIKATDPIILEGRDFGAAKKADSRIVFTGAYAVDADIQGWTSTKITCRIPAGARSGTVKVITTAGTSNEVPITLPNQGSAPQVGTLDPVNFTSNIGNYITFTATFTDADGFKDLQNCYLSAHITTSSQVLCLYAKYYQSPDGLVKKFYIADDTGRTWLGGYEPGAHVIISNSRASLDCSLSRASGSGNTLTVQFAVAPRPLFTGVKNLYMKCDDQSGKTSGDWVKKGWWTIPENRAPGATSLYPVNGASQSNVIQPFTASYYDPDSVNDLKTCYYLLSGGGASITLRLVNDCSSYEQPKVYMANDPGKQPSYLGGFEIGSNNVIENSYAKLYCDGTDVYSIAGRLIVIWKIEFKAAAKGVKSQYVFCLDQSGRSSPYDSQYKGTWTIQ